MWEGIFGFILTIIYSKFENPFVEINTVYKDKNKKTFFPLIICLIIYFINSGGRNIY